MHALLNRKHKTNAKTHNNFNMSKQLTCVCVCERCHELQVLLHKSSLVHHSGTGGRHKGHGGSWGRRCFWSKKGADGSQLHWSQYDLMPPGKYASIYFTSNNCVAKCYFNILTPNADVPRYRRTVMTSFNAAGDHKFLQPTVSLIESGFSMKTGTLQRHRKHLYQVQINLKKRGKNMHTCILFIWRNSKCGWWATILFRGKEHIFQHLAVFNVIMPRNAFP